MNNNDQSKEHSNAAGSTTGNMAAQVDDALAEFIDSQIAGIQARFEEEYSEIIRTLKAGVAEEQAKNKQLDEELKIFQSKDKDIWDEIRLRARPPMYFVFAAQFCMPCIAFTLAPAICAIEMESTKNIHVQSTNILNESIKTNNTHNLQNNTMENKADFEYLMETFKTVLTAIMLQKQHEYEAWKALQPNTYELRKLRKELERLKEQHNAMKDHLQSISEQSQIEDQNLTADDWRIIQYFRWQNEFQIHACELSKQIKLRIKRTRIDFIVLVCFFVLFYNGIYLPVGKPILSQR